MPTNTISYMERLLLEYIKMIITTTITFIAIIITIIILLYGNFSR